jgi:hypothetical protein
LKQTYKNACTQVDSTLATLQRHLQIATILPEDVINAANARRKILDLPIVIELTGDTKLDTGITSTTNSQEFNKVSALRDIYAVINAGKELSELGKNEAAAIVENIVKLENDSTLLTALQQRAFIEKGLDFINGTDCPLCDIAWESEELLRKHLIAKLTKSAEAQKLHDSLKQNGNDIASKLITVMGLLKPLLKLAEEQKEDGFAQLIRGWITNLETLKIKSSNINELITLKNRFEDSWLEEPINFTAELELFLKKIDEKPDQTTIIDAQTFLTTAQIRLGDYREATRKSKADELASKAVNVSYETYCLVIDDELNALYDEVQKDFSTFYRVINSEDEATFSAKLTPSEGSLGLDVNFYNRGLFPPAAYHSEGHQDGMGVCLYLALMKHLFGDNFTFALFDDVVMSVDTGHRYQFCKLLKEYFPNTQFIITTHDRLWAEQMKSAGLVTGKTSIAFYSWTIDTGPLVESKEEIWKEIADALNKGKVESAAAALRHHLEYSSRHLADLLGATPQFRADGNYELGDLLPAVISRLKRLYVKASESAKSWGNGTLADIISTKKEKLLAEADSTNIEQWVVNKAVHYNSWANFSKNDFEPVVRSFKELLSCFNCEECSSWQYVTPRINSEALRCNCNKTNINLKMKPK